MWLFLLFLFFTNLGETNIMKTTSIDLNRIRSMKKLEEIKADINFFLNEPIVKEIYIEKTDDDEYGGEEGWRDDVEDAKELLDKVERRIASLGKYLKRQPKEEEQKS
jgi:hypothetical protein